jgi:hypothetical protein
MHRKGITLQSILFTRARSVVPGGHCMSGSTFFSPCWPSRCGDSSAGDSRQTALDIRNKPRWVEFGRFKPTARSKLHFTQWSDRRGSGIYIKSDQWAVSSKRPRSDDWTEKGQERRFQRRTESDVIPILTWLHFVRRPPTQRSNVLEVRFLCSFSWRSRRI